MKKFFALPLITGFLLLGGAVVTTVQAQTPNIGIGTTTPNNSAMLDVTSTNRGFLAPRMDSAQRVSIASPAIGLLVYQTNGRMPGFWYNVGTATTPNWQHLGDVPTGIPSTLPAGSTVRNVFTTTAGARLFRFYAGDASDAKNTFLYRASDLRAAGVRAGIIRGIQVKVMTKGSTGPYSRLGIVMQSVFSGDAVRALALATGEVTPNYAVAAYSTVVGWNTHLFNVPFVWNGTADIGLTLYFDSPDLTGSAADGVLARGGTAPSSYASILVNGGTGAALSSSTPGTNKEVGAALPALRIIQ